MEEVKFFAQIKSFNKKALVSNDTQIRLILDCQDVAKKQNEVMEALSSLEFGDELVEITIKDAYEQER